MTQVYFTKTLAWAEPVVPKDLWEEWLARALTLAPRRTDLAIPFLTYEAVNGHDDHVRAMARSFLARDRYDAVGLYFLGLENVRAGDQVGLDMLRRSVDHGIELYMPLDPQVRTILYPVQN